MRHKLEVLTEHCRDVGRDPKSIIKVFQMTVYLASSRSKARVHAIPAPPWP
jgi:hypothetical protein